MSLIVGISGRWSVAAGPMAGSLSGLPRRWHDGKRCSQADPAMPCRFRQPGAARRSVAAGNDGKVGSGSRTRWTSIPCLAVQRACLGRSAAAQAGSGRRDSIHGPADVALTPGPDGESVVLDQRLAPQPPVILPRPQGLSLPFAACPVAAHYAGLQLSERTDRSASDSVCGTFPYEPASASATAT